MGDASRFSDELGPGRIGHVYEPIRRGSIV